MKRDNSVQDRDIKFYLDEEKKSKAGQHLSSQDDVGPDWLTMSVALAKLHLVTFSRWSFQAQKVWKIFYMGLALACDSAIENLDKVNYLQSPDPSFNPNLFSEDEEDISGVHQTTSSSGTSIPSTVIATVEITNGLESNPVSTTRSSCVNSNGPDQFSPPTIAPMTPRSTRPRQPKQPAPQPPPDPDEPHEIQNQQNQQPSPKNAVAPTQTLIATSAPSAALDEYANNVQRMKTALADQQSAISSLVQKDLEIGPNSNNNSNNTSNGIKALYGSSGPAEDNFSGLSSIGISACLRSSTQSGVAYTNSGVHDTGTISGSLSTCRTSSALATLGKNETAYNAPGSCKSNTISSDCNSQTVDDEQRNNVPELKYQFQGSHHTATLVSIGPTQVSANSIVRSCSVGYLDLVDVQIVPCDVALNMLRRDAPNKRLFLVSRKNKRRRRGAANTPDEDHTNARCNGGTVVHRRARPRLSDCVKSRSLDSSELFPSMEQLIIPEPSVPRLPEEDPVDLLGQTEQLPCSTDEQSEIMQNEMNVRKEEATAAAAIIATQSSLVQAKRPEMKKQEPPPRLTATFDPSCLSPIKGSSANTSVASSLEGLNSRLDGLAAKLGDYEDCHSLPPPSPRPSPKLPRSSPCSPAPSKKGKRPSSASPIRRSLLSSPLLDRRSRKKCNESSDEEGHTGQNENRCEFTNLETFQKMQLRQKILKMIPTAHYPSRLMQVPVSNLVARLSSDHTSISKNTNWIHNSIMRKMRTPRIAKTSNSAIVIPQKETEGHELTVDQRRRLVMQLFQEYEHFVTTRATTASYAKHSNTFLDMVFPL
ncbi:hypothetical protein QAD02_014701 [Eretmocerus hayati]|uniref:Uncharacterized protein n=1 Tax=Eretmocerus hayati TaxID=131215 RepID=A0ACC2P6K7_9HYME|nr:hypothetical protein QAD02_014701 [Eretmocerus hayati]